MHNRLKKFISKLQFFKVSKTNKDQTIITQHKIIRKFFKFNSNPKTVRFNSLPSCKQRESTDPTQTSPSHAISRFSFELNFFVEIIIRRNGIKCVLWTFITSLLLLWFVRFNAFIGGKETKAILTISMCAWWAITNLKRGRKAGKGLFLFHHTSTHYYWNYSREVEIRILCDPLCFTAKLCIKIFSSNEFSPP